jgi:hypothetical protein
MIRAKSLLKGSRKTERGAKQFLTGLEARAAPFALLTLVILACLSNNACTFGVTAPKYLPAQGPRGVNLHVETSQWKYSGELIEVRDTGILMLADQKLRLLPYTAILSSKIDQTPSRYFISKTVPKPDVQAQLRLVSRFPQGLTPELTRQLLDAYGQMELAGVNP